MLPECNEVWLVAKGTFLLQIFFQWIVSRGAKRVENSSDGYLLSGGGELSGLGITIELKPCRINANFVVAQLLQ